MRFVITTLCGGKAQMAASREYMDLDMARAEECLASIGRVKTADDMMIVAEWNGMEVTLYPQGKVMFHPLTDKSKAAEYASEILSKVV